MVSQTAVVVPVDCDSNNGCVPALSGVPWGVELVCFFRCTAPSAGHSRYIKV
jgi:hypothetical protein